MAGLWSLTRAAVKLLLFQDNDLSYSIQPVITIKITDTTQGEMSAKTYKILELVIPHDTLFHHQLDFAAHLT